MIAIDGEHMKVSGPLTLETARAAFAVKLPDTATRVVIDLAEVSVVDSAALGVLMQWVRQAQQRSAQISFINVPQNLRSLADLYDVAAMLPLAPTANLT